MWVDQVTRLRGSLTTIAVMRPGHPAWNLGNAGFSAKSQNHAILRPTPRPEPMHLLSKIERIRSLVPPPAEKIDVLISQLARLRALEKIARERLVGKQQRRFDHRERKPPRRL